MLPAGQGLSRFVLVLTPTLAFLVGATAALSWAVGSPRVLVAHKAITAAAAKKMLRGVRADRKPKVSAFNTGSGLEFFFKSYRRLHQFATMDYLQSTASSLRTAANDSCQLVELLALVVLVLQAVKGGPFRQGGSSALRV